MRAVTVSEYGGTPVVGEIPTPEPGAGQVLRRMRAAGMNPMDGTLASGAWRPAAAGRWVLAVAVLGEAMVLPEVTVVNVALPSIGRDMRAGVAGL